MSGAAYMLGQTRRQGFGAGSLSVQFFVALNYCSSEVNLSGVNGNVIMSGWEDDNLTMRRERLEI